MLNLNLLRKELHEQRWVLILGIIIFSAVGIFCAWSFKMFQHYGAMLTDISSPLIADELQRILADYNYYLWSQWQPKNLLQFGTILALVLAAPAVAGELSRGSMDYLLSRPLSRTSILLTKATAGALILSAIIWSATLGSLAAASLIGPALWWGRFLAATALVNAGLLCVYGIGLLFSTFCADSIKAGVSAGGLLLALSGCGIFPATRFLSPFWHAKGSAYMGGGSFPWVSLILLLGASLGFVLLAARVFNQQEY